MLNHSLFSSLDNSDKSSILTAVFKNDYTNNLLQSNPQAIDLVLKSKFFSSLPDVEAKNFLKINLDYGIVCNDILMQLTNHSTLLKHFNPELVYNFLYSNTNTIGGVSERIFNTMINSKAFNQLSESEKLSSLIGKQGNILFKLMTNPEVGAFKAVLNSNLSKEVMSTLLNSIDNSMSEVLEGALNYENIAKNMGNIIQSIPNSAVKSLVIERLIGVFPKLFHKDALNFDNYVRPHLSGYQKTTDKDGFSLAYYARSLGDKDILKNLKAAGHQEIMPNGYYIKEFNKHDEYTVKDSTKTAFVLVGMESEKVDTALYSSVISTLHKKGFNVLALNIKNANNAISLDDIKESIIKFNNAFGKSLDLVIIDAHGNNQDNINDAVISLGHNQGVAAADLLKSIVAANQVVSNGSPNPLEVLISSCRGQAAVEKAKSILPQGSHLVTLGEKQIVKGQNITLDTVNLNFNSMINYLYSRSDIKAENFNLKNLVSYYLGNLKIFAGSPTYTDIGENCITTNSDSIILKKLDNLGKQINNDNKATKVIADLCGISVVNLADKEFLVKNPLVAICKDDFTKALNYLKDH